LRIGGFLSAEASAGQSASALPDGSDINLFGNGKRVVNLDAEVTDGTFNFRMSEQ
jgi:hypothetical protein